MNVKYRVIVSILLLSLFAIAIQMTFAGTTSVTNNVSVSANTGGNSSGSVQTGQASASVHIEQSVNGVNQPTIDIATTSASGSISVKVHSEIASGTATSSIEVRRDASPANGADITPPLPKTVKPFVPIAAPVVHIGAARHGTTTTGTSATASSGVQIGTSQTLTSKAYSFFANVFDFIRRNFRRYVLFGL